MKIKAIGALLILALAGCSVPDSDLMAKARDDALAKLEEAIKDAPRDDGAESMAIAFIENSSPQFRDGIENRFKNGGYTVVVLDKEVVQALTDQWIDEEKKLATGFVLREETVHAPSMRGVDSLLFGTLTEEGPERLSGDFASGQVARARLTFQLVGLTEENATELVWGGEVKGEATDIPPGAIIVEMIVKNWIIAAAIGGLLVIIFFWLIIRRMSRPY